MLALALNHLVWLNYSFSLPCWIHECILCVQMFSVYQCHLTLWSSTFFLSFFFFFPSLFIVGCWVKRTTKREREREKECPPQEETLQCEETLAHDVGIVPKVRARLKPTPIGNRGEALQRGPLPVAPLGVTRQFCKMVSVEGVRLHRKGRQPIKALQKRSS